MPRASVDVQIKRKGVSYPVLVCPKSSAADLGRSLEQLGLDGRRACVLIDAGFARARRDVVESLQKLFPKKSNLHLMIPGNESSKSIATANSVLGEMISFGLTRNDLCVAVGGGVVGDLGGFVASVFHRGMDVVHVPTTLLAMVDSSIGGKTAVNHPLGKNLIGTFHQPRAVIEVLDFLETLPHDDFQSGLGEVFKYAVGFSPSLYGFLMREAAAVHNRTPEALTKIILESARIKARIVGADERESGKVANPRLDRRLLNLGHTLGHGIEKAYDLPHGMAVAVGVTLAAKLSVRVKMCPQKCYDQVMELGSRLALKTEANVDWGLRKILPYVMKDKKIVGDRVQFVCLKKIGHAVVRPTRFSELKVLET